MGRRGASCGSPVTATMMTRWLTVARERALRLMASHPRGAGAASGLVARRGLDGDPNLEAAHSGARIEFLAVALEIWRVGDLKI